MLLIMENVNISYSLLGIATYQNCKNYQYSIGTVSFFKVKLSHSKGLCRKHYTVTNCEGAGILSTVSGIIHQAEL
jgi:hypothetical protein